MSKPPRSSTKPPCGRPPAPRRFLSWSETGDESNATIPIEKRDAISLRIRTSAENSGLLLVESVERVNVGSLAFRSRGAGKVVLPRAGVEFFDPLHLLRGLPAQSPLLRFGQSARGFQFD